MKWLVARMTPGACVSFHFYRLPLYHRSHGIPCLTLKPEEACCGIEAYFCLAGPQLRNWRDIVAIPRISVLQWYIICDPIYLCFAMIYLLPYVLGLGNDICSPIYLCFAMTWAIQFYLCCNDIFVIPFMCVWQWYSCNPMYLCLARIYWRSHVIVVYNAIFAIPLAYCNDRSIFAIPCTCVLQWYFCNPVYLCFATRFVFLPIVQVVHGVACLQQ